MTEKQIDVRKIRENWLKNLDQAIHYCNNKALKAGRITTDERRKYLHTLGYLIQVGNKLLSDGKVGELIDNKKLTLTDLFKDVKM